MSEPVVAQKEPYGVDVKAGEEYWWCACGRSESQPFCDGSHKRTDLRPVQFVAPETTTFWFCGCKHSGNRPECDGSHRKL